MIARSRVLKPITDWRVKKTRWVVTRYPTHGAAQEAKMSLEELLAFGFEKRLGGIAGIAGQNNEELAPAAEDRASVLAQRLPPAPEKANSPPGALT